jgi:flagellin-like hook-associated protein FlgL
MSSDIVLTAALRNNLLSLQNTQRLIDSTQLRLATGLKVNSALDNPSSFFTAQSLSNRAGDLSRLLDNINLSLRTIEEADKGITSLTSLVEQAQSIASSARDELAASEGEARAVGNVDLSNTATLIGLGTIADGDNFNIETVDDSGNLITENVTISTGDTAYTLAAKITDQFADNQNGEITAEITDQGFLSIQSVDGRTFRIRDELVGAGDEVTLAGFAALGLDRYFEVETLIAATRAAATIVAGNTISSISLYESAGNLAEAGDFVAGQAYLDADGNTVLSALTVGDSFNFTVNNSGTITSGAIVTTATTTWQDLVDQINQTAAINDYIEAEFDSSTGQIKFTSLQDTVENLQIIITTAAAETIDIGLGDPSGNLDPINPTGAGAFERVFSFNSSTQALDQFAADFNTIREQINQLVVDANFRGVNLLNGDDLVTFFNENNTSSLTTSGATFTADGLGLTEAAFRDSTSVELSATQARDALGTVRSFGSSLANSLAVIQTRRDFTEATINVLEAGADDLTVADQNEEGANLLALQTRQALGVTSLSLASQSQQSVLRLF